ncbi:hypothetical protein [Endozoicomonas sp. ALB032]|uniref:hypothetical protein n=1 Tax=Endozoicomonas sp. ALB032 TaxID=3403082 RepID=UPI003BB5DC63
MSLLRFKLEHLKSGDLDKLLQELKLIKVASIYGGIHNGEKFNGTISLDEKILANGHLNVEIIDFDAFMQKIAPYCVDRHGRFPRIQLKGIDVEKYLPAPKEAEPEPEIVHVSRETLIEMLDDLINEHFYGSKQHDREILTTMLELDLPISYLLDK